MGESFETLARVSLRDAMMHTALCDTITIREGFELTVRPWTAVEVDDLKPLIVKILGDFKSITDQKLTYIEGIVSLIEEKWNEYKSMVLHAAYVTLERSNKTLRIDGVEYKFFSEEEMATELPISVVMETIILVWKQNFEKNLSRDSSEKTEAKKEIKISEKDLEKALEKAKQVTQLSH